jgi:putative ABC transport system substrate-binding protein
MHHLLQPFRPVAKGRNAQQRNRVRRIGVLSLFAQDDGQGKIWDAAFRRRLNGLGWVEGSNLEIQIRWAAGDLDRAKAFAKELTAFNPDVLLGITTPATAALQRETRTIPILFAAVSDPIGSGFVKSLANPDGNITGFMFIEASLASKWPDLMRAIAPQASSVGILFNPLTAPYARYYLEKFYPAAEMLHIEAIEAVVSSTADIESMMAKFGDAHAGVIVMPDTFPFTNRKKIISLAERYRLPIIYPFQTFVSDGGLMSYGADPIETHSGDNVGDQGRADYRRSLWDHAIVAVCGGRSNSCWLCLPPRRRRCCLGCSRTMLWECPSMCNIHGLRIILGTACCGCSAKSMSILCRAACAKARGQSHACPRS